jgi:hypothetical protein
MKGGFGGDERKQVAGVLLYAEVELVMAYGGEIL